MASQTGQNAARHIWGKRDIFLILFLLLIALVTGIWYNASQKEAKICRVLYGGETVMLVPLDMDRVFFVEGLPQVMLEVREGRIAFIQSDCPDKTCVRTGFIGEPGQFAACLPNRLTIRIEGQRDEGLPDALV